MVVVVAGIFVVATAGSLETITSDPVVTTAVTGSQCLLLLLLLLLQLLKLKQQLSLKFLLLLVLLLLLRLLLLLLLLLRMCCKMRFGLVELKGTRNLILQALCSKKA